MSREAFEQACSIHQDYRDGDGYMMASINKKWKTWQACEQHYAGRIVELETKLGEVDKDAERLRDLLIEAQAEIQECLDDHCNMMETKPHRPAIWQRLLSNIDQAIESEKV